MYQGAVYGNVLHERVNLIVGKNAFFWSVTEDSPSSGARFRSGQVLPEIEVTSVGSCLEER